MPENQRRAILLREWQGLSYREIAAELELSQAAVETLIFRARRSLASTLESEAKQPGRPLTHAQGARRRDAARSDQGALRGRCRREGRCRRGRRPRARSSSRPLSRAPSRSPRRRGRYRRCRRRRPPPRWSSSGRGPRLRSRSRPSTTSGVRRSPKSAPTRAVATPQSQAPATATVQPEQQKVKHEPKATPPGQAKKHERAVHANANANAGKDKVKEKTKSKDALPALEQAAPTPEQAVTPWRPTSPRATARATKRRKRARRSNGGPENRGLH